MGMGETVIIVDEKTKRANAETFRMFLSKHPHIKVEVIPDEICAVGTNILVNRIKDIVPIIAVPKKKKRFLSRWLGNLT